MSINTLLTANTSNNPRRLTPEPNVPYNGQVPPPAYVRPADWPALATLSSTLIYSGLLAVYDTSLEYVALTITGTGTLTVDWGDGTSETLTSAVAKQHQYNYSTLGTSVTTRDYKTALVNVTTTGTITAINLQVKPVPVAPNNALIANWGPKWLDIILGGSNLTTISIGGTAVNLLKLEQVSITQTATITSVNSIFQNCYSLQSCPTLNFTSTTLTAAGMFQNCLSLIEAPMFDTSKVTNITSMFEGCNALQEIPNYDLLNCTTLLQAFRNCHSLITIPSLNLPKVTTLASAFAACPSLEYIPTIYTSNLLLSTSLLFSNCVSLKNAPMITNTSNVTDMSSMFAGCSALQTCPLYETKNVAAINSMFQNCSSLTTVPGPLNLEKAINMGGMFNGCISLKQCPILLNTSLVDNTTFMFFNATSLESVPLFDTSNVIFANLMFSNCQSLTNIPLFDTSKVTSMANTFSGCSALKEIPPLNTTNVSNMLSTFSACRSLQTTPNLDTSNVTITASMFANCNALMTIGSLNLTKCSNMQIMFAGCSSLLDASNVSNTGNVLNMAQTFNGCASLQSLPASWDTSKVTNMSVFAAATTALQSIPTYNTINVTNNTNFALATQNVVVFPALNFSNVTTTGTFVTGPSVTKINSTGMKVTHSVAGTNLGSTELANYMNTGIVANATAQTLTITGAPGATTALVKTGGTTANSSVITMANTVGVLVGTYIYGTGINTGIQVSFIGGSPDSTFAYIGAPNHGLQNGDSVMFTSLNTNPGLTLRVEYYVVNRTATNFQLSLSPGGTRIILSATSQGVISIGGATIANRVNTVTSNVSIAINGVSQVSNAAASLTSRALNQNYATTKNWIITG